jgi:hypothetical protein
VGLTSPNPYWLRRGTLLLQQFYLKMFFDAKLLVATLFIITNFSILFLVKTRFNIALSLIFTYLLTVLCLSITVSNYENLKELTIVLAIYTMVMMFLIFYHNPIVLEKIQKSRFEKIRYVFFIVPICFFVILATFFSTFWIVTKIEETSYFVAEKKIEQKNEELFGSLKSSESEITIDELRGIVPRSKIHKKILEKNKTYKTQDEFKMSARRRSRLQDKMAESFLLKRSSDFILIITALLVTSLLLAKSESETELEINA